MPPRKYECHLGHKWLPDVAGLETCPRCGAKPIQPKNAELEAAKTWQPPPNHSCNIIDLGAGITVVTCSRR